MKQRRKRKLRPQVKLILILVILIPLFIIGLFNLPKKDKKPDYTLVATETIDIPPMPYNFAHFFNEDHFVYYEDDNYYGVTVIDVSTHNGDIDWKAVKESGINHAFLRLGYRGYKEGILHVDDTFEKNYKEAKEVGITLGVYFFSQSINEQEAMDEAFFVLDNLKKKEIELPVVYDLEDMPGVDARTDNLEHEMYTKMALAFCQKIQDNGYQPMIYMNKYWSEAFYDLPLVYNYPIWFAQYNNLPNYNYDFTAWQYTDKATIPGVKTPCDVSIMFFRK